MHPSLRRGFLRSPVPRVHCVLFGSGCNSWMVSFLLSFRGEARVPHHELIFLGRPVNIHLKGEPAKRGENSLSRLRSEKDWSMSLSGGIIIIIIGLVIKIKGLIEFYPGKFMVDDFGFWRCFSGGPPGYQQWKQWVLFCPMVRV